MSEVTSEPSETQSTLRPVRSALFVPANREEWIEKSPTYGADTVVLDLEDATPLAQKAVAQEIVKRVIPGLEQRGQGVWVRVNELDGPFIAGDLEACARPGVDAVCLPKVRGAQDIRELDSMLSYFEGKNGLARRTIRIVPLLETASAIADAAEVFRASPRVAYGGGIVATSGDVALAVGFQWSDTFQETHVLRAQVLIAARAGAIHNPFTGLVTAVDPEPVRRFAAESRALGYEGMFVIHPSHVPIVNEMFRPSAAELAWSAEVIETAEVAEGEGRGAFVDSQGRMIDTAMLRVAQSLVERDRLFEQPRDLGELSRASRPMSAADSTEAHSSGPLSDIRVIDMGHVLAGPFAATLLGDLGADVIKVENPRGGDTLRTLSPKADGVPVWWKVAGRNKRCVALDLKVEEAKEILLRLIDGADVLVENFRAGTLERMGFDPKVLMERNPKLIILRISGFGQGPLGAGRPGYGRIGEAMSGTANLTGEADGRPLHVGFSLGDATSGLMGAYGVLAALHERERSGRGDIVDLALFESLFRMIEWQLPMADLLDRVPRRQGNQFPIGYAVAGSFKSSDSQWVALSAATTKSIARVLNTVGGEELAGDSRFATAEGREEPANLSLIEQAIQAWMDVRNGEEIMATFADTDVAVGYVYDAGMMLDDPLFAERQAVVSTPDPQLGTLRQPGVIPKLHRNPGEIRWSGAEVGAHTVEVMLDVLGLSDDDIQQLEDASAFG